MERRIMIYKILKTNGDGQTVLARIDDDGISRFSCTDQNPDYLKWLEEGNTPEPADTQGAT
jgi:hypothetical protein